MNTQVKISPRDDPLTVTMDGRVPYPSDRVCVDDQVTIGHLSIEKQVWPTRTDFSMEGQELSGQCTKSLDSNMTYLYPTQVACM